MSLHQKQELIQPHGQDIILANIYQAYTIGLHAQMCTCYNHLQIGIKLYKKIMTMIFMTKTIMIIFIITILSNLIKSN